MHQTITDTLKFGALPAAAPFAGMVWIPGGLFRMGSENHYPEEKPVHRARVNGFWMDARPVTNAESARFVRETGHVTFAEIPPNPADYPGALPEMLCAGSLVFVKPPGPLDLRDMRNWWTFMRGTNWRHPQGPGSTIDGKGDHPVVHVAYADAQAYAKRAGKPRAMARISRTSASRARSSRAARTCARQTTAGATVRPRAFRSRWTPPRATSAFAASFVSRNALKEIDHVIERAQTRNSVPGVIGRTVDKSQPAWPESLRAKKGAPNVLFIVLDDTCFGQLGCYGSPIRMPNIDKLAKNGALCRL